MKPLRLVLLCKGNIYYAETLCGSTLQTFCSNVKDADLARLIIEIQIENVIHAESFEWVY